MKVRTYTDMKSKIQREVSKQMLEYQYEIQQIALDECFRAALAVAVSVFHRRGRTEAYIQKFVEDFTLVLETLSLGQSVTTQQLIKQYGEEYHIDFDSIHVNSETKEQCLRRHRE